MAGQRKKGKRMISNIVLVLAIGVFVFSGYQLIKIFLEYHRGESEYENIQEIVIQEKPVSGETEEETVFSVDFAKLKEINADTAAWLRFDEPSQISYPVVKGSDNSKYLHITFEGKKNAAGTLFMDFENELDFSDRNTFIYGHNMKNGSMFGQLRKYKSKEFWEANPYFYIYTPDGKETTYQIFSVSIVKDTSESYQKWYVDDKAFSDYVKFVRDQSLYTTDVEVKADAHIVSLSTCTNVRDDERLLVQGVKIGEKVIEE